MSLRQYLVRPCVVVPLLVAALVPSFGAARAVAATSAGCTGGGFTLVRPGGSTVSGDQKQSLAAAPFGAQFVVRGRYVEFKVDSATFGVRDWTLTGAPNPLDLTGGRRTAVFASKIPDHRGLALTGDLSVELKGTDIVLKRSGPGL